MDSRSRHDQCAQANVSALEAVVWYQAPDASSPSSICATVSQAPELESPSRLRARIMARATPDDFVVASSVCRPVVATRMNPLQSLRNGARSIRTHNRLRRHGVEYFLYPLKTRRRCAVGSAAVRAGCSFSSNEGSAVRSGSGQPPSLASFAIPSLDVGTARCCRNPRETPDGLGIGGL